MGNREYLTRHVLEIAVFLSAAEAGGAPYGHHSGPPATRLEVEMSAAARSETLSGFASHTAVSPIGIGHTAASVNPESAAPDVCTEPVASRGCLEVAAAMAEMGDARADHVGYARPGIGAWGNRRVAVEGGGAHVGAASGNEPASASIGSVSVGSESGSEAVAAGIGCELAVVRAGFVSSDTPAELGILLHCETVPSRAAPEPGP